VTNDWDVLEYPRVREILAGFCRTSMGAEQAFRLRPFADRRQAEGELNRLAEVVALDSEPELGGVTDVRPLFERAVTGGVLAGTELLGAGRALAALSACRLFLNKWRAQMPLTGPEFEAIDGDERLAADIALALDEAGVVVDSASAKLAGIREKLRGLRGRLVHRLEALMAEQPGVFGERSTIRHNRHVVPVRVEHRDKLAGVVHERSATGQTLFIEPFTTVGDQNRLEELRGREAEEVARILRSLSERAVRSADRVVRAVELAGRLDFLFAGRRFAAEYDCTRPELTERRIRIVGGRHPVLVQRRVAVVPLDLDLPDECDVLLVSGPNAGGKTVVLKTVGLFCLLAASGVFVPAAAGTKLAFCRRVFADIGDDQSLDADLSSFTAHIGKIRDLLRDADRESLVLLDEVGASTSPEEGAALAIAILKTLNEREVRVVATSHFWTLKLYVQDHARMMNAAMGMAGAPTYRLTLGLPGESSALDAARAAGLPEALLERAREHVGQGWVDLAGRLRQLRQELDRARAARTDAERQLAIAARVKAEYESKLGEFRAEENRLREREVVRRRKMLEETRREIENLVREIRESQASREAIVRAKRAVEKRLGELEAEAGQVEEAEDDRAGQPGENRLFAVGDLVESRTLRQRGRVEAADVTGQSCRGREPELVVAFGSVRMHLPAADLSPVTDGEADGEGQSSPWTGVNTGPEVSLQLNLLGQTREEALEQVDGYLAEASAAGLGEVRVLHGKGTGVLQRAVWRALRLDARVSGFRFAELNEGGRGVTVVELRTEAE